MIKKYILIILITVSSTVSYGQEENKYSIGIDANYLSCYLDRDTKNNINYGFSLLITEKIAQLKIGIGINYSKSTYNYTVNSLDYEAFYLKKREYMAQYLNFPILVFFNINSGKTVDIDPYIGIIANRIIKNEVVNYYIDSPPFDEIDLAPTRNLGFTFRAGINASKTISKHIILSLAPFADFKFVKNFNDRNTKLFDLPVSGGAIGFKIGFDYLIN